MATYDDLCAAVESCGLPFARIQFDPYDPDGIPDAPFCILMPLTTRNRMGSNAVVAHFYPYDVELYTDGSDMELEKRVQSALEGAGFAWQRSTVTLEDGIVQTTWSLFCTA